MSASVRGGGGVRGGWGGVGHGLVVFATKPLAGLWPLVLLEAQSSWVAGVHRLGAALEACEGGPDYWLGSARYTESTSTAAEICTMVERTTAE